MTRSKKKLGKSKKVKSPKSKRSKKSMIYIKSTRRAKSAEK